jgi:hypothetical protein
MIQPTSFCSAVSIMAYSRKHVGAGNTERSALWPANDINNLGQATGFNVGQPQTLQPVLRRPQPHSYNHCGFFQFFKITFILCTSVQVSRVSVNAVFSWVTHNPHIVENCVHSKTQIHVHPIIMMAPKRLQPCENVIYWNVTTYSFTARNDQRTSKLIDPVIYIIIISWIKDLIALNGCCINPFDSPWLSFLGLTPTKRHKQFQPNKHFKL